MFTYIIPPKLESIEIWGTFSDFRYLELAINNIMMKSMVGETPNDFLSNFSKIIDLSISSQENTFIEYGAPPNFVTDDPDDPSDKSKHHTFHLHRVSVNPIDLALSIAYLLEAVDKPYTDYLEKGMVCLLLHTVYDAYKEYCEYSLHPIDNAQLIVANNSYTNIQKKYIDVLKRFDKMTEKQRNERFESLMIALEK